MKLFKRTVSTFLVAALIAISPQGKADMFGGDGVPRMARV